MSAGDPFSRVDEAARVLADRGGIRPRVAVVLGSGLGSLVTRLADARCIDGRGIPHWPVPTATGHAGEIWFGRLAGAPVALLAGRVHLYEGASAETVVMPIRVLWRLGVQRVVLTNAAGGIAPHLGAGALMLIDDHINMTGASPLAGPHDPRFGPRFPDMSEVYSRRLLARAEQAAEAAGVALSRGVYLATLGPSYETPAEIRFFRTAGADAVGMSTVLEAVAARHLGMEVLGLSCITNAAAGLGTAALTHDDVLIVAQQSADRVTALLEEMIGRFHDEPADGETVDGGHDQTR